MAASTSTYREYLPIEMIERILGNTNISVKDVVYFSMTCKEYYRIINESYTLWRSKFFERWPSLIDVCKAEWSYKKTNAHEEFIERMKCREELCNYFSVLNEKYWVREDLSSSDLRDFGSTFRDERGIYSLKFYYLLDDLTNMLNDSYWWNDVNLTHIYYTKKVLLYMKQYRLKDEWFNFINLPRGQQILEGVLAIAHQWFLLDDIQSVSSKLAQLDSIVDETYTSLAEKSLFSISAAQQDFWRYNNIENYQWEDPEKTKEMLHVIHHILYEKFGQIDDIGSKLHLKVIFHAVARTFGIRCDVVHSADNVYLIWGENYDATSSKYKKISILNICSDQLIFEASSNLFGKEETCSSEELDNCIISPTKLMTLCSKYMWHSLEEIQKDYTIFEFHYMVNPKNMDALFYLADLLAFREMDLSDLIALLNTALADVNTSPEAKRRLSEMLENVESKSLLEPSRIVRRRVNEIKYAIGMIVRLNNMMTVGVISGWVLRNPFVTGLLALSSHDSIGELRVNGVYYAICPLFGEVMYVHQDNVIPVTTDIEEFAPDILRYEIGRYFSYFKGTHFIPSPVLEEIYPDDANVREQWLSQINSAVNQDE